MDSKQIINAIRPVLSSTVIQTPWLGIRILQNKKELPLQRIDDKDNKTQILLRPEPFELYIPDIPAGWVRMCSSYEPSIFDYFASAQTIHDVPFFHYGTGIADTPYSTAAVFINQTGHMHLNLGKRLQSVNEKEGRWRAIYD